MFIKTDRTDLVNKQIIYVFKLNDGSLQEFE